MIEKHIYLVLLFDFYSKLLTDKQSLFFDLYYNHDLSLGEIAEEYMVSRSAVYDTVKRVEVLLLDYEKKLNMAQKFEGIRAKLKQAIQIVSTLEQENKDILELQKLLLAISEENY